MNGLKTEIQRSKQLMGLSEGLNLQKKQSPASWFRSILNRTTGPYTTPDYPNSLFYKLGGDVIFQYNQKNGEFLVDFHNIWSIFHDRFGMQDYDIQALIKSMVEEHYKLGSVTPNISVNREVLRWKNITNWDQ